MNLENFEGFGAARNREDLHAHLKAVAHWLDFELYTLVIAEKDLAGNYKFASLSNAPDAWQSRQNDPQLAIEDPVHTHLRESHKPLIWTQDTYVQAGAGPLWELGAPYGYKVGVAVTFPLGAGRKLMIGIDRHQSLSSDPAKTVGLVSALQLLAAYGQDSAGIASMFPTKPLSNKQQRVMALVAAGKSNAVIAEILDISPDTVAFHIKAVFARLGVSTRQQAALEVERLGLISPELMI
ncbi:DNA-binding CsgD family transcriptional regulator [Roseateles asaccharophilus]|uniref:autoinducer binding domain-containing protein n=1 Tax=Roseateles asaccharophilus TaxID=582607 RepID=UPI0038339BA3